MSTITQARHLDRGALVECPRRSSIGPHEATVTHVTQVGTGNPGRFVVSLDCGHDINMTDAHGLYLIRKAR